MNCATSIGLFFLLCLISQTAAVNVTIQISGPDMNKAGCSCGLYSCSVSDSGTQIIGYYNNISPNVDPFLLIQLTSGGVSCRYSVEFNYSPSLNTLTYSNGNDKASACTQIGGTMAKQSWNCRDGFSAVTIYQ